jgi:PPOX class probable FMN-dependent enzyme
MSEPHRITTLERLRAIMGDPGPATALKINPALDAFMRDFIARSPFLILSTADAEGRQDASPKGDQPGFVAVADDGTLLIPDRSGNRLLFGLQNLLVNRNVGVLFMIPGVNETLRVNGRAELTDDPTLCGQLASRGRPALLVIRVTVEECFFHCAKAFLRSSLWKPAAWPERPTISFGKMMAPKLGGDEQVAQAIDAMIEEDYRTNL